MTVHAVVQSGSGRELATREVSEGKRPNERAAQTMPPGRAADANPASAAPRCSPDPCQHTDRYRLVTPFSLRL